MTVSWGASFCFAMCLKVLYDFSLRYKHRKNSHIFELCKCVKYQYYQTISFIWGQASETMAKIACCVLVNFLMVFVCSIPSCHKEECHSSHHKGLPQQVLACQAGQSSSLHWEKGSALILRWQISIVYWYQCQLSIIKL